MTTSSQKPIHLLVLPSHNVSKVKHIAVSGNIGSGKTTLVEKLSKHYGWVPLYESVDDNPYLRDFYDDMTLWAFHLQVYFLNSRFNQIHQIQKSDQTIIQDRTIYEDAYIFASNLHQSGHLNDRDYQSYLEMFEGMINFTQSPDLLIYLKADVSKLVEQIRKRSRDFEINVTPEYLKNLNAHYDQWIGSYNQGKMITIDMNKIDFVEREKDFSKVIKAIDKELNNLIS